MFVKPFLRTFIYTFKYLAKKTTGTNMEIGTSKFKKKNYFLNNLQ